MSLQVISDLKQWSAIRRDLKAKNKTIGFVPTMGALHAGHASLLERSHSDNEVSVLSIYVNPTQFDNKSDLEKYPSTLEQDQMVASDAQVDYLLLPTYPQIYPDGYRYKISESSLSLGLCGAHRPGHFDGVLTVVMKLLNLVEPNHAYFGEKDYQQYQLIKGMAEAFFMNVKIIGCPTLREKDGLAMSSRNLRLSPQERQLAPRFHEILLKAETPAQARQALQEAGLKVEYVEEIDGRRYGAVHLGQVRLIDNV